MEAVQSANLPDNQEPLLTKVQCDKFKTWHWWVLVLINFLFLIVGQSAAVLLGRFYYDQGGNSKWVFTLVQTAGFPILYIPLYLIPSSKEPSRSASVGTVFLVYFVLGIAIVGDNWLYSVGLLYLSASTYSLICASQLAFNAVFSYFINAQKFTILISSSVIILTVSSGLISIDDESEGPSRVSKSKYLIGFAFTIAASVLYSLLLSLMQLTFQRVLKKETFSVVLEMQIYTSVVATCISVIALFASGEWKTLHGEMNGFGKGHVSYMMTLVWTAVSYQVCSVGLVGLIFLVSSLFSNVISTLSLALTPMAALIFFHDKMSGLKIAAMLMAFAGFAAFNYQNYLDEAKAMRVRSSVNTSSC